MMLEEQKNNRIRRRFTDEFKRKAVRLVEQPDQHMWAEDLGLDASALRRWMRDMQNGTWDLMSSKPLKMAQQQEIEALRRGRIQPVVGRIQRLVMSALCSSK